MKKKTIKMLRIISYIMGAVVIGIAIYGVISTLN